MNQYIQFFFQNWILCSSFLIVIILIVINEVMGRAAGAPKITPQQTIELINRKQAKVIDIRNAESFKQGHILGAENIPASHFASQTNQLKKNKNNPIILVCQGGYTTVKISEQLKKDGYDCYMVKGGMTAWLNEGFPTEK